MISPGKVTLDRSNKADCCSPLFMGPTIVVEPPTISDPSAFLIVHLHPLEVLQGYL